MLQPPCRRRPGRAGGRRLADMAPQYCKCSSRGLGGVFRVCPMGEFMFRVSSRCVIASVLIALAVSLSSPSAQAQQGGDRRLGAVETSDQPASAAQLGAGWTRLRFVWSDIQPNDSGQWNDAALEA